MTCISQTKMSGHGRNFPYQMLTNLREIIISVTKIKLTWGRKLLVKTTLNGGLVMDIPLFQENPGPGW